MVNTIESFQLTTHLFVSDMETLLSVLCVEHRHECTDGITRALKECMIKAQGFDRHGNMGL